MTIKEGIDNAKATGPRNSMIGKSSGEEKATEKSPVGGNPEDHRNKPVISAKTPQTAMLTSPKTGIQKLSNDVEKVAKIANSSVKEVKSPVSRDGASKSIPHYLRPSTSSCHDACKYGAKSHFESSDASKHAHTHARVSNKTNLAPSKSAVPKTYKDPNVDGSSSSSTGVGHSSKVSPKEKTIGNIVDSEVKMVKSTPGKSKSLPSKPSLDKKPKLTITPPTMLSRSVKPVGNAKTTPPSKLAGNGHGNAKTITPPPKPAGIAHGIGKAASPRPNMKAALKTREHLLKKAEKKTAKSDSPRSASSTTSSVPQEEKPNEVGTLEISGSGTEELGTNNPILANVGGDAHQFYEHSQSTGESSDKEHEHVLMKHNDYEDDHSVKEQSNDGVMIPIARESTDCDEYVDEWNADLEPYGENLAMEYDDQEFDDQYSEFSEYSENSGSGSHDEQGGSARVKKERQMMAGEEGNQGVEILRFRRGRELPVREENRAFERRRFRRVRSIDHSNSNPQPENVVLRHQDVQGRKASEEFMLNHVIEETVNKLAHTRKSKVKALVGAFETVISLKESETSELKHAGTKDLSQLSTLQECT